MLVNWYHQLYQHARTAARTRTCTSGWPRRPPPRGG
eukprot:COSAG02_NODE_31044_length_540_cov_1.043084_1_plen_35_part_01